MNSHNISFESKNFEDKIMPASFKNNKLSQLTLPNRLNIKINKKYKKENSRVKLPNPSQRYDAQKFNKFRDDLMFTNPNEELEINLDVSNTMRTK